MEYFFGMDFWQSVNGKIYMKKKNGRNERKEGEMEEEWNDKRNDSQLTARKQTWTIEKEEEKKLNEC